MAQGVSVKFKSYEETIPKFLQLIKFNEELKKHSSIVLKPSLRNSKSHNTPIAFVEEVLKFCMAHKNPDAKIILAEGSDGEETHDVFEELGYKKLAERYPISLVDLNNADVQDVYNKHFIGFEEITYPKIIQDSYLISLPRLNNDDETEIHGSLSNMLGAFPASYYTGFFSSTKNKIRKNPIKYAVHDIVLCKMPNVALVDASDYGYIIAGKPLEVDKQSAKLLGIDWKTIQHLKLIDETQEQIKSLEREKALKAEA